MRKAISELFGHTSAQVDRLLGLPDLKFAMIDGWEDPQRLQLFGLSVCCLQGCSLYINFRTFQVHTSRGSTLILKLERHLARENAEACAQHIDDMLSSFDLKATGIVSLSSDNCPAMVAAVRDVCQRHHLVQVRCLAHWANLVIKDVFAMFEVPWSRYVLPRCIILCCPIPTHCRAKLVAGFINNSHYPKAKYLEQMARHQGSTMPSKPSETRWGVTGGQHHQRTCELCLP